MQLWRHLYTTLTTAQINEALSAAGYDPYHVDDYAKWMEFVTQIGRLLLVGPVLNPDTIHSGGGTEASLYANMEWKRDGQEKLPFEPEPEMVRSPMYDALEEGLGRPVYSYGCLTCGTVHIFLTRKENALCPRCDREMVELSRKEDRP